jgi:hypothetical protein
MRKARAYHGPRTGANDGDSSGASHAIFQDKNLAADFAQFAEIMRRLKVGDIRGCIESAPVRVGQFSRVIARFRRATQ